MMARLRDRPTADLIVISMAGIIGFVIVSGVIGGIIWRILDQEADIGQLVKWIGDLTSTLIGAVVGFLAGKGSVEPPKEP
jgi:hypothetical protein